MWTEKNFEHCISQTKKCLWARCSQYLAISVLKKPEYILWGQGPCQALLIPESSTVYYTVNAKHKLFEQPAKRKLSGDWTISGQPVDTKVPQRRGWLPQWLRHFVCCLVTQLSSDPLFSVLTSHPRGSHQPINRRALNTCHVCQQIIIGWLLCMDNIPKACMHRKCSLLK